MRPIHLQMEAFGPFADSAQIDFEGLPADRPFVIGGPTGSGKTCIFDAMTFALYGSLPGHRVKHHDLRSDHADPAATCSVTFVFDAGDERWRITRTPRQRRASRRGDGLAKLSSTGSMQRWHGGAWQPVEVHVNQIQARVEDLLGLSRSQFERVVLLPQGDFEKVLNDKTTDREELLRSLFGTEVFLRAVSQAAERRESVWSRIREAASKAAALRANAADALARLQPGGAALDGAAEEEPDPSVADVIDITDRPSSRLNAATRADGGELEVSAERLGADVAAIELGVLREQQELAERAAIVADSAEAALTDAQQVSAAVCRRRSIEEEIAGLESGREAHERDVRRVVDARQATGVIQLLDRRDKALQERRRIEGAVCSAWEKMIEACATGRIEVLQSDMPAPAAEICGSAELALARCSAIAGDRERLVSEAGRARELRASVAALTEEETALAERRSHISRRLSEGFAEASETKARITELTALAGRSEELADRSREAVASMEHRRQLDLACEAVAASDARLVELTSQRSDLERGREEIEVERGQLLAGEQERDRLLRSRRDLEALGGAVGQLVRRRDAVDVTRRGASSAQVHARAVFDLFVADSAPRLAAQLADGEPCLVCGSVEHPSPALASSDDPVDSKAVDAARHAAERAHGALIEAEQDLAALLGSDSRVGTLSTEEVAGELESILEEIRVLDTAAERADSLDVTAEDLAVRLGALEVEVSRRTLDRQRAHDSVQRLRGVLGDLPRCSAQELSATAEELRRQHDDASSRARRSSSWRTAAGCWPRNPRRPARS